jgi:hypothetical protein
MILQSIAAGVLGKAAFAGGAGSATLGLFLHFLMMCAMAAVYWIACRRWPWMLPRPAVMPSWFADGLLAHILLVGLLFAFVARLSAGRSR